MVVELQRPAAMTINRFLAFDLTSFAADRGLNQIAWYAKAIDEPLIKNLNFSLGHRSHGEFAVAGNAELANEKDVQRRLKGPSHFERDGHAASRQREYRNVRRISIVQQLGCQIPSRIASVSEYHDRLPAIGQRSVETD
jgi:hypothetical protein